MKVNIVCGYSAGTSSLADLPIEKWEDIKNWYVRWDTFHYTLDGEKWETLDLNSDVSDCVDWKRPISVEITDEDYTKTLAESE
jgi:hypothetical protein